MATVDIGGTAITEDDRTSLAKEFDLARNAKTQTADTVGRTLAAADIGNLVIYNSSANGNLVIPTDAVLGLTGNTKNVTIEVYQAGTGVPNVIGDTANGVTVRKWQGYPTSSQYVTTTLHWVGANTWALK